MAGIKGMRGGGGPRPNSGRKKMSAEQKKPKLKTFQLYADPELIGKAKRLHGGKELQEKGRAWLEGMAIE